MPLNSTAVGAVVQVRWLLSGTQLARAATARRSCTCIPCRGGGGGIYGSGKGTEHNMAKYHNKNVALNKPHYATGKDAVHHKSVVKDGNHVKKVLFGDPNMWIRKSTGAPRLVQGTPPLLHPGPKTKPNYWSCKACRRSRASAPVRALFTRRRIRKATSRINSCLSRPPGTA